MWVNRDWVGPVLPADTPRGGELAAYARWANAVEGNTTFYALPSPATVDRWSEQAPTDFRFLFKLPREITHLRRLRDARDLVREMHARLEPLGDRCGPWWIQLPESFGPDDVGALQSFLTEQSTSTSWVVEVRHRGFDHGTDHERRLNTLLAELGVDRVLFHTRPLFDSAPEGPDRRLLRLLSTLSHAEAQREYAESTPGVHACEALWHDWTMAAAVS